MATNKEKMDDTLKAEQRERIVLETSLSLSRKDWRDARDAIGIEKSNEDEEEVTIMLAYKRSGKSFEELDAMGGLELGRLIFGEELAPTLDEQIAAIKAAITNE